MWFKLQNGEDLIKCNTVTFGKTNLWGYGKENDIVGMFNFESCFILGSYSSEENRNKVMKNIEIAISKGENLFIMPKEKTLIEDFEDYSVSI